MLVSGRGGEDDICVRSWWGTYREIAAVTVTVYSTIRRGDSKRSRAKQGTYLAPANPAECSRALLAPHLRRLEALAAVQALLGPLLLPGAGCGRVGRQVHSLGRDPTVT